MAGGEPLGDLNIDIPGRTADMPKYIKGNVGLVFTSIFPSIETFRAEESRKLEIIWHVVTSNKL
jgi:membrane dipeptidase